MSVFDDEFQRLEAQLRDQANEQARKEADFERRMSSVASAVESALKEMVRFLQQHNVPLKRYGTTSKSRWKVLTGKTKYEGPEVYEGRYGNTSIRVTPDGRLWEPDTGYVNIKQQLLQQGGLRIAGETVRERGGGTQAIVQLSSLNEFGEYDYRDVPVVEFLAGIAHGIIKGYARP